jgi:hypothetical protein
MPFALVPDGFELKKVTQLQKEAVDRYYRHQNVNSFIANPELLKQVILTVSAFLIAREGKDALKELKELGASIPKTVEDAFTEKRQFGDAPVGVSFEDLVDQGLKRLSNLL